MCDRRRKVEEDLFPFPSVPFPLFGEIAGRGGKGHCRIVTSLRHPRCMGIKPKKSPDPITACLSITRPARNTDVLKIQRRASTLSRDT